MRRGTNPAPNSCGNESYYFDFATPDGSLAGYVRLGLYPNWDRAWYWAALVGPGRPLVIVADNNAPLPEPAPPTSTPSSYKLAAITGWLSSRKAREEDRHGD